MSSLEYSYWMALASREPIGPLRADWHAAQIVTALANIHRGKHQPARKIKDFLLFSEPEPPDPEELDRRLRIAFGAPPDDSPQDVEE